MFQRSQYTGQETRGFRASGFQHHGYSRWANNLIYGGGYGFWPGAAAYQASVSAPAAPPYDPALNGPVSFADLPASTGIVRAPASEPLFMRINGRTVSADNGERPLWRSGPRIVHVGQVDGYRARRMARTDDMDDRSAMPKIIVIRP